MGKYNFPGVYVDYTKTEATVINTSGSLVGAFVGVAMTGPENEPVLIKSWEEYVNTFAYKQSSAFISNSDLAYCVLGFFINGGASCYVMRAVKSTSVTASSGKGISAKTAGTWGNSLKVKITEEREDTGIFTVDVKYGNEEDISESYSGVGSASNPLAEAFADSKLIKVTPESTTLTATTDFVAFTGGTDVALADTDYTANLNKFNLYKEIDLFAIPGQSNNVNAILAEYATARTSIAVLDTLENAEPSSAWDNTNSYRACIAYPWINIKDPVSGNIRKIPSSGSIMGVMTRITDTEGISKAPAGTTAVLKDAVSLPVVLTDEDYATLHAKNINAIVSRRDSGIVLWGARSLCTDDVKMKYVSDLLLNQYITKNLKSLTEFALFKKHDSALRTQVNAVVTAFLDTLWREGNLVGSSAVEAYYVKCDESNNTQEIIDNGQLIIDVGYAGVKPAEFVIIRLTQSIG